MNRNWEWLFPVIIFFIWIVNTFLRSSQEERRNRRTTRPMAESGKSSGRSQTEIEKFLEEVNRRRRQVAERRSLESMPVQAKAPSVSRPPVGSIPRTPSVNPTAARRVPRPQISRPVLEESVVVAEVVAAEPVRNDISGRLAAAQIAEVIPVAPPSAADAAPVALQRFSALFRSPEGLQTAWLASEIFGPPRCRRYGF